MAARRVGWVLVGAVVAACGGIAGGVGASADGAAGSAYHPLTPVRLFDTRSGSGAIGGGASIDVVVGGTNGVPADATAVALNVTEVAGTASSFLTVWPTGAARPTASSLNWSDAGAHPNAVTVALGAGGKISVFNNSGSVQVLADVLGYFTTVPAGGAPTGPAGGVLTGAYPAPGLASKSVTPSNLSSGAAAAGSVLTADGSGGASFGPVPSTASRTVPVPFPASGDEVAAGAALRAAVAAHPDGRTAYLLDPGAYVLGDQPLVLPPGTTIRGAGRFTTFVLSSAEHALTFDFGLDEVADLGLSQDAPGHANDVALTVKGSAYLRIVDADVTSDQSAHTGVPATGIRVLDDGAIELRDGSARANSVAASSIALDLSAADGGDELHGSVVIATATGRARRPSGSAPASCR